VEHPAVDHHLWIEVTEYIVAVVGVILIVGALTFFPALSLGPLVEHFAAGAGRLY